MSAERLPLGLSLMWLKVDAFAVCNAPNQPVAPVVSQFVARSNPSKETCPILPSVSLPTRKEVACTGFVAPAAEQGRSVFTP